MSRKKIYLVLSQTGTIMSRCMKLFTRAEYNHISLALDESLEEMYSFSRLRPNSPFPAGFMVESKNKGTYARFKLTKVQILELEIEPNQYEHIQTIINGFMKNHEKYKYNYLGAMFAIFNKECQRERHYYCSQFVKKVLIDAGILDPNRFIKSMRPIDYLNLEIAKTIFTGLLINYKSN